MGGQLGIDSNWFRSKSTIMSAGQLDTTKESGVYYVHQNAGGYINNGLLMVFNHSTGSTFQLFSNYSGTIYRRICWYGTWKGWYKITDSAV